MSILVDANGVNFPQNLLSHAVSCCLFGAGWCELENLRKLEIAYKQGPARLTEILSSRECAQLTAIVSFGTFSKIVLQKRFGTLEYCELTDVSGLLLACFYNPSEEGHESYDEGVKLASGRTAHALMAHLGAARGAPGSTFENGVAMPAELTTL